MKTNLPLYPSAILELQTDRRLAGRESICCKALTKQQQLLDEQRKLRQINQLLLLALAQADAVNAGITQALLRQKCIAQYDELTGAPNRRVMQDRIQQIINANARRQQIFALLFIDLDHFKPINDRYGHVLGDKVLQQVVSRLHQMIRASDTLSRQGGDEFLLLLPEVTDCQAVCVIAEKLLQTLSRVYTVDGHQLALSASIGIALFPEDGTCFTSLVSKADSAMYRAKRQGGNCYSH
ncbi:hypothetical protein GCM10010919_02880 [Alishewanella longhuensis]|uniref:GGDEF domain-containing protein n=1 Tax=Alishewanella longhuensis TaxID=1091037 RepID=A0ABQ3KTB1_9ALTE|nr:GGDEF domain-containing protein [Alishewanella longhuensis]GHG59920.1 hypothetical protein GCM10010919_02880 [Alishewanella longhuensis]